MPKKNTLKNHNFEEITEIFRYASSKAASKVLEIYQSDQLNKIIKEDNSPLTKADIESNRIIIEILNKELRSITRVSEESPIPDLLDCGEIILIDPLDGTKEFLNKNGEFTINIALVQKNLPQIGVIDVPVQETQYYSNGIDSFKKTANSTKKITVKKNKTLTITISRSHLDEKTLRFLGSIENFKKKPVGSSIKLCLIAEGMADLYVRYGNTMEWDIAAGHAILKNSGGNIFSSNLRELEYGKEGFLNTSFIAFNYLDNDIKKKFTLNL